MSVCAVLWTHNEPDVLEPTLKHLLAEVDEILIRDRASDGKTRTILNNLSGDRLHYMEDDGFFGFDQSRIMTDLAMRALERGHQWVIPVDPDEIWYANGRTLSDYLAGVSWDVGIVKADLFNHVASVEDDPGLPPFQRIGWRQRMPLPLPKVAARLRPDLVIEGGNHSARTKGIALAVPGLVVRHFPYRSEDQFIEKVRSNYEQLRKSRLPADYGAHIRAYGRCLEEEGEDVLRAHFRDWFLSQDPGKDDTLIWDPAPVSE
jgi:Glycosyl transferase family 2